MSMTHYYAKRAAEYEAIYQKPERQENLKQLQAMIAGSFTGRDLLEIACGTGYWTQFACRSACSILATDYNEEVLSIAREKNYRNCQITFVKSDAYALEEVDGPFSAALVGFWWSHVPKAKMDDFFQVLHRKLIKEAKVLMMDNRYVEGSSTPVTRIDEEGNTYQTRKLLDGSTFEVLKNFPSPGEFVQPVEPASTRCKFMELDYFWVAEYDFDSR